MKRGPEELEEGEIPEEQGDNHEEQGDIHKNKKNKPEQELELELAMSPLQNEEDDYEDEQEEMIIAPVEVKSEVDEFINKMVEDVPYVDNIDDDVNKIKSTLDKIAVDTYFPDFLKIINGNNYTQSAIDHINKYFLKNENIKNITKISDFPHIKDKTKATASQLLQLSLALAHLAILRLREDPAKNADKNTKKVMQCMYALKIYVLSEQGAKDKIMSMFEAKDMGTFRTEFDNLIDHIVIKNTAESVGARELIQSISNLQDEFRGNSAAPPPGENDSVEPSISTNATLPVTVKARVIVIFTHLLFQSQANDNDIGKILGPHYIEDIVKELRDNINIFQLSSDWLEDSEEKNESKINHLGASIVATNGVPTHTLGGKARKTRRIKRTKKASKKIKRNTKKGRKGKQTKRRK